MYSKHCFGRCSHNRATAIAPFTSMCWSRCIGLSHAERLSLFNVEHATICIFQLVEFENKTAMASLVSWANACDRDCLFYAFVFQVMVFNDSFLFIILDVFENYGFLSLFAGIDKVIIVWIRISTLVSMLFQLEED